jgi:hypothetical protein
MPWISRSAQYICEPCDIVIGMGAEAAARRPPTHCDKCGRPLKRVNCAHDRLSPKLIGRFHYCRDCNAIVDWQD